MTSPAVVHDPTLTAIRWVARVAGALFIVATIVTDAIVIGEIIGGSGPNWATLTTAQIATLAVAFGVPLVEAVGVAIAWLKQGTGETIGGAITLIAALIGVVSALLGLGDGGVSMALSATPMALAGAAFMYCGWRSGRVYTRRAA